MSSRTVKSDRHYRDHSRRSFIRLGMGVSVLILGFGGYMFATASNTETAGPPATTDPAVAPTTPPDVTIVDVTTTTAEPASATTEAPPTTEAPGPDPDFLDPAVGFAESEPVTVSRVVTAGQVVLSGGRTVELAGIDAPAADACYGDEARQALIRRLSFAGNGQVLLYSNGDDDNVVLYTDPPGPLTPEVNADIVLVGAADIRPGWRDADFRTGRDAARAERIGLWGEC